MNDRNYALSAMGKVLSTTSALLKTQKKLDVIIGQIKDEAIVNKVLEFSEELESPNETRFIALMLESLALSEMMTALIDDGGTAEDLHTLFLLYIRMNENALFNISTNIAKDRIYEDQSAAVNTFVELFDIYKKSHGDDVRSVYVDGNGTPISREAVEGILDKISKLQEEG
jgi:hypothetical protein